MFKAIVSQRVDIVEFRNEVRDALDQNLLRWVIAAGGVPFPLPNVFSQETLQYFLTFINPDIVILTGGNDIGSATCRDLTESFLLEWASSNNVPTLGICRGMQMLTIWSGGSLHKVDGHVSSFHDIEGEVSGCVNSYHNYAIDLLPEQFHVIARSGDGVIEAIKHKHWKCEGWMWHPERDFPFCDIWLNRLMNILIEGKKND